MKNAIPALPVQDIEQSKEFYTTKFGFTVQYHDSVFAKLVRDDVEIHLWAASDESWKAKGAILVNDPVCSGAESFIAGTGGCRIEVQGIDELYEEYKKQQVIYDGQCSCRNPTVGA